MNKVIFYYASMRPSGGVERVISNLVNTLSKEINITVLTKDKGSVESFYPINSEVKQEVLNCPVKMNMENRISRIFNVAINIPLSILRLRKYLKHAEFEYIYTASPMGTFETWVALGFKGSRIIASEHASYNAYNALYEKLKRLTYPKVKVLSVPTTLDTSIYLERKYPAVYIPHLTTFDNLNVDQRNFTSSKKRILNVGRLTDDKRQILLLELWRDILEDELNNKWVLEIVGAGELHQQLGDYIEANDMGQFTILSGSTSNISEKYNNADIFAFTSKTEGFGMVLLEAMAFSVPCISFDIPSGPRDIISDCHNGFLIEEGDYDGYKEKLLMLMADQSMRETFSNNAVQTVLSWPNDRIRQNWLDIFTI